MDKKIFTQTFRHSFLQLYFKLTYQFVSKEFFIKSKTVTLNYNFSIAFIQINNVVHKLENFEPEPGEPSLEKLRA
jgi:hypothetical protein